MADARAAAPRLSLIVQDGRFERVHYALVLATGAAAVDRPVTLFFTGRALVALEPSGWRRLEGREPGDGAAAAEEAALVAAGVAGFEALLEAARELGVRFIACEMGLRAEGMDAGRIDSALGVAVAGVVTLLNQATGPIVFV